MALPTASDNEFPKVILEEVANDGSATVTPAADHRALFLGEDGILHLKDSAGAVTTPSVAAGAVTSSGLTMATARLLGRTTASTGAIEEITVGSGLSLSAGALTATGGSSYVGFPTLIAAPGFVPSGSGTDATAERAFLWPVNIPGPMKLRALIIDVSSSNTGQIEWGLFDASSNAAACTKVAGGSAAPGGTDYRAIAATGAPVSVSAGTYFVILRLPSANVPTIRKSTSAGGSLGVTKVANTYTWDNTPDITSGGPLGFKSQDVLNALLVGDVDASNQW